MYRCAAGKKVHFLTTWNTYQVVLVARSSARMLCHIGDKAPAQFHCVRSLVANTAKHPFARPGHEDDLVGVLVRPKVDLCRAVADALMEQDWGRARHGLSWRLSNTQQRREVRTIIGNSGMGLMVRAGDVVVGQYC